MRVSIPNSPCIRRATATTPQSSHSGVSGFGVEPNVSRLLSRKQPVWLSYERCRTSINREYHRVERAFLCWQPGREALWWLCDHQHRRG